MFSRLAKLLSVLLLGLLVGGAAAIVIPPGEVRTAEGEEVMTGMVELKVRTDSGMALGPRERTSFRTDQASALVVDGLRLLILTETVVIGANGAVGDFNQLPVPSRAEIKYRRTEDGNLEILRLRVLQVHAQAETAWPLATPH